MSESSEYVKKGLGIVAFLTDAMSIRAFDSAFTGRTERRKME